MDKNKFSNLIDILKFRSNHQKDDIAYTFINDIDKDDETITYKELESRARKIASTLINMKTDNNRVLIIYPPGIELITAFLGCLYANFIAIPCQPSNNIIKDERINSIIKDAEPAIVILKNSNDSDKDNFINTFQNVRCINIEEELEKEQLDTPDISIDPESIAFLQYTSGSTALPKGVKVTHKNLMHNLGLIKSAFGLKENSSIVLWLPPFHNTGLIGGILESLYVGYTAHLMSTMSFIRNPLIWLKTISEYKVDSSGAPNFAYDLCVKRITEEDKEKLDLSNWTLAFSGSEPIKESTLKRFFEAFKKCGFKYNSFYCCYGLAESTLIVSGGQRGEEPIVKYFEKESLKNNKVLITSNNEKDSIPYVSNGQILNGVTVNIVNPNTLEKCNPDEVGEIWIKGDSVAKGYWNRADIENEVFNAYMLDGSDGPYLRTGDLGAIYNGELFITGRIKDLIIIRGKNYYPQDIEMVVEASHPLLTTNSGAAFSFEVDNEEKIVIAYEIDSSKGNTNINTIEIISNIRQAVFEKFNLQVYDVVLLEANEIPKTISGKVRRSAVKQKYINNNLKIIANDMIEKNTINNQVQANTESLILSAVERVKNEEARQVLIASYLQEIICKIAVLDINDVSIDQDVGTFGMDSIDIIEFAHLVEDAFEVSIPFKRLYQRGTILEFSKLISEELTGRTQIKDNIEIKENIDKEFQLSKGQKALWFLYKLDPNSVAYNISCAVSLEFDVQENYLHEAFSYLKKQHPIMNDIILEVDNKTYQKINPQLENNIKVIDAKSWSEEEIKRFLDEKANTPFNLVDNPLIKVYLLKRDGEKNILLFVLHHIIADFWGLSILLKDFISFYKKISLQKQITIYDNLSYKNFIDMQNDYIDSEKGEEALKFFKTYLKECPPKINLPLDYPRPNIQTFNGKSVTAKIGNSVLNNLNEYSKANNITLFATLLTSFYTLLHHFSKDKDIVVGVPMAARSRASLSKIVGYCTNMLPIRVKIDEEDIFNDLLERVNKSVTDVFVHQEYPFSSIVEDLQVNRDISYSSIYQVAFVYQHSSLVNNKDFSAFALGSSGYTVQLEGYKMESLDLEQEGASFDLTFMIADTSSGLEISVRYNSDIFKESTALNVLKIYEHIITNININDNLLIKNMNLLSSDEFNEIMYSFNKPYKNYNGDEMFQEMFVKQAKAFKNKPAIIYHEKALTYKELDKKSSKLAKFLIQLGVKPDSLVSLYMDRSVELFIGILGVLKSGGAYIPIDTSYPKDRLEYMIEDSNSSVIITKKSLLEKIPAKNKSKVILIDELMDEKQELEESFFINENVKPENLCYLIYTSGSTGKPKGVMINHKALTNFVHTISDEVDINENDVSISLTTASFDMFVFDSLVPLVKGGTVVLPDESENRDANALMSLLCDNKVTIMQTTPSRYKMMFSNNNYLSKLKSLRIIMAGGEPFSYQLLKLLSEYDNYKIYNAYGPTESTVYASICELQKDSKITIGKPIQNTSLYILNDNLKPLPVGVVGELYISGNGLAKGYYNKLELTKEKFIKNPFNEGSIMYRTGDQVRWLPNGNIEYLGRIDNQIKVRGFRIEIEEIEKNIMDYEGIDDVAVIDKEDEFGNKYLCAYLISSDKVVVDKLSKFLLEWLPHYMIPSYFVQIDEMPMTPNGKINKRELRNLNNSVYIQDNYTEPENEIEEKVKGIWQEVLSTEKLSTTSNFFLSGGDSLKATSLVNGIQNIFNIQLSISDVFKYATIKQQSEHIKSISSVKQLSIEPKIYNASQVVMTYPASEIQKRVYLAVNLDTNQLSYNMPGVIVIKNRKINIKKLEESLLKLIDRHESLRTSFDINGEEVVQQIHKNVSFKLQTVEGDDIQLDQLAKDFIKPFDLSKPPLIKAKLVSNVNTHALLIDIHHIIMDGASLNILISELASLYNNEELIPLTMQYKDFSQWQRELLETDYMKEKEKFWLKQFEDTIPSINLPYDFAKTTEFSYSGASYEFNINKELTTKLNELTLKTGSTLYMLLLSSFYVLLSSLTEQKDIVVGTLAAGRNHKVFENTIGMFVNTILLRNKIDYEKDFVSLLEEVKNTSLEAFENQEYPFEQLISKLDLYDEKATNPLVEVMFIFQNVERVDLKIENTEFKVEDLQNNISKFNLTLEVKPEIDEIRFKLEYRTDLFKSTTIESFSKSYIHILEQIVNNLYVKIKDIELLTVIKEKSSSDFSDNLDSEKSSSEIKSDLKVNKEIILPENDTEKIITAIWNKILKKEEISTDKSFFSFGGNSLKAFRVINDIYKEIGVEIPYKEFFKHPTIKQMSEFIDENIKDKTNVVKEEIYTEVIEKEINEDILNEPFKLSELQEAYWFGRKKGYELGNIAAHAYIEMDIEDFRLKDMQKGILKIIKRHPMLRTVILPEGVQQIKKYEEVSDYKLEVTDIEKWDEEKKTDYLNETRSNMSHQVLESNKWPLFEIKLTKWNYKKVRIHFSIDLLIVDSLSLQILLQELNMLYNNPSVELEEIKFTYKDYIKYLEVMKNSDKYKKALNYWKENIKYIYPAPELPQIKNQSAIEKPKFVRRSNKIDSHNWKLFKEKAAKYQLTPTVVLAAIYANVLSLWSKNKEFTINMTKFNRPSIHKDINNVIGDFTSIILLSIDASNKNVFKDFAAQLQDRQMESMDYSEVDGVHIMREYAKQRGLLGKAAMPIVFTSIMDGVLEEESIYNNKESSFENNIVYSVTQTPQVMLDNQVTETNGELLINWDAIDELFPKNMLDDMFEQYYSFINELALSEKLWELPIQEGIVIPKYQKDIIIEKHKNTIEESKKGFLYDSFLEFVDKTPNAIAIETSSISLTYKETFEIAEKIKHWVSKNIDKEETLVAVILEKGWEQVVSTLGIMMAGGAYLPIQPNTPKERVKLILESGNVKNVITKECHSNKFSDLLSNVEYLMVDNKEELQKISKCNSKLHMVNSNLAYVIYTSGSTGQPKGVMIEHKGVVNTIEDINKRFSIKDNDKVLQISALNFDLSVYDIFGLLSAGGTIVIPDERRLLDPSHWHELIEKQAITVWNTVPAYMEMYMEYLNSKSLSIPESLRLVMLSGDKISVDLPRKIFTVSDNLEVISLGGATEASIWSIIYPIDKQYNNNISIPYGESMYNQCCYVMDKNCNIQPMWVPGEICIGGIGVARGYYGDDEKTNASFIINPNTGERLYKTGDIGRYNKEGYIDFIGREDNQVKVRGYRIELGEIEAVLNSYPGIQKSVVTVVGNKSEDKQIVAYYTPSEKELVNVDVITNPIERLKFKMSHYNIRESENEVTIKLDSEVYKEDSYIKRRSYRRFREKVISFSSFSKMLECLKSAKLDGYPLPKYQYSSAGSLYPVQTYIYAKENAIEGISEGIYYFNPLLHELVLIESGHEIVSDKNYSGANRDIFNTGSFAIFFVSEMSAIYPMYGDWSKDFCLIESGLISQLLEMNATSYNIGLCQVGDLKFDKIREHFKLTGSHIYLHSLIGGYIDYNDMSMEQFLLDNSNTINLINEIDNMNLDQSAQKKDYYKTIKNKLQTEKYTEEDIYAYAKKHLPEYMVPKFMVQLDEFPLSANGKVDYKLLPNVKLNAKTKLKVKSGVSKGKSQTEITISNIWSEVLDIDNINVDDNIFDIGGTSIQLIRIHSKLCKEFSIDIPIVQMFAYTTIRSLSEYIDKYIAIQNDEIASSKMEEETKFTAKENRINNYRHNMRKRGRE